MIEWRRTGASFIFNLESRSRGQQMQQSEGVWL